MRSIFLLTGVLFAGCTQSATQIVAIVGSDYPSPEPLTEVRVRTQVGGDRVDGHVFALSTVTLPFSFGITPGPEGVTAEFLTIELEARSASGTLSTRRAIVPFVKDRSMALPLFLSAACRGTQCAQGETCTERGCAPEAVDVSKLQEVDRGRELSTVPSPSPSPSPLRWRLTVQVDGMGSVQTQGAPGIACGADCTEDYAAGATVRLVAGSAPGARFVGWQGDCSGEGTCTVVMDSAQTVTARFVPGGGATFPLQVRAIGDGVGRVTSTPDLIDCPGRCDASPVQGTSIELRASTGPGNVFQGWSGDCAGREPCVVPMDRARQVTAEFRRMTGTVRHPHDLTGDGAPDLVFAAARLSVNGPDAGRVYVARSPLSPALRATDMQNAWDGLPGELFGSALAWPGDMDGDGYADVMVGAPGASQRTGAVYMIAGGPTMPTRGRPMGAVVTGERAGTQFGASILVLPDLDGDGRVDLAVGAPGDDTTPGAVYLFMSMAGGRPTGAGSATIILRGERAGDHFGAGLAWVGDVDGDGRGELAVTAPGGTLLSGILVGKVYLFRDPTRGTIRSAQQADWVLSGTPGAGALGAAVAAIGDWDQDGRPNFAIASPLNDQVFVYPPVGAQGPLVSGSVRDAPVFLNASGEAGRSLAGVGDLDGDGFVDLAVGAPSYAGRERGAVLIYRGGNPPSTEPAVTIASTCLDERACLREAFGLTVAGVDDLDGDGRPELAVGSAFGGGAAGTMDRGRIAIFKGGAGLTSGSAQGADYFIVGEDSGGMCVGLPGSGVFVP